MILTKLFPVELAIALVQLEYCVCRSGHLHIEKKLGLNRHKEGDQSYKENKLICDGFGGL